MIVPRGVGSLATHIGGFIFLLIRSLLRPLLWPMTMTATQLRWCKPLADPKSSARSAPGQTLLSPPPPAPRILGVATSPLLQRMVGIFLKETQPLKRGTQRMTPPQDAVLKAQASKLEWMTATFVPTKKLSCA